MTEPRVSTEVDALREELQRLFGLLRDGVPAEFHSAAVVELLRTMDLAYLYLMETGEWPNPWEDRVRFGTVRALSLFVPGAANSAIPMAHRATEEHVRWAGAALVESGTLALMSLWADYAATGLVSIHRTRGGEFRMRVLHEDAGVEALEREDLDWLRAQIAAIQVPELMEWSERQPAIRQLIESAFRAGLFPADPQIEEYFETAAVMHAERLLGYDYFPNGARLGGLDFLTYKYAVVALIRRALADSYRVRVLLALRRTPLDSVSARGCVIPIHSRGEIERMISDVLENDRESASRVVEFLTLDAPFAAGTYPGIPHAANPPFVQVSREHLAFSIYGCLNAPFQFLLARLRDAFPRDWNSAANLNEAAFRDELYGLFAGDRFVCVPRGIMLRAEGQVLTDVDAFVLDRETGEAGLFQLKWWFTFGASMRERSSGAKNLAAETSRWVERVTEWLRVRGLVAIADAANLARGDRRCLARARLFVIGRHSAHFSGQEPNEDGSARGTWPQVVRLMRESDTANPIAGLWEALRSDSPHRRVRVAGGRVVLRAGDLRVSLSGYRRER